MNIDICASHIWNTEDFELITCKYLVCKLINIVYNRNKREQFSTVIYKTKASVKSRHFGNVLFLIFNRISVAYYKIL
jgi:hypothetical protein